MTARGMTARSRLLLALATTALSTTPALAGPVLPTGGKVVAGSAAIGAPMGGALSITQSSSKAILNWGSFSIGQGGKVAFDNGKGATLNRVTGASLSSLDGLLTATGSVYLINPNGVIVGKSGVVNVGGTFVASTLDTPNASFLKGGALSFSGSSDAAVVNYGRIGALGGDVALIAAKVTNAGTISAANGDAGLLAGYKVVLKDNALDEGRFAVELGGAGTTATNSGLIQAADAELRAEGGNVYALAGDTAGVIRATGVKTGGGKVWLVADQGTLSVAGGIEAKGANGAGGRIETSGRTVDLGAASIDAHGGSWTVDPTNLEIDAAAATTISNALANADVLEQTTATTASGAGNQTTGAGDITLDTGAAISWGSTHALTLSAYHDIDLNGTISLTGAGTLTLRADNAAAGSGTVNMTGAAGQVTLASGATADIYYNPTSYTDTATASTLELRPGYAGPTIFTNPYANPYDASTGRPGDTVATSAPVMGGTVHAYMLVDTLAQLGGGLMGVGSQLNGLYALNADIDASSTATANPVQGMSGTYYGFLPIGFTGAGNGGSSYGTSFFTGQFDGQGHTISNLYINHFTLDSNGASQAVNYAGLFGYVNAGPGGAGSGGGIVHDLNLANATVLASAGSNGVAIGMLDGGGEAYGLTASGTIGGGYFTGGLIGTVYGTGAPYTVYDSHASTTVNGGQYLGGLFGQMYVGATANNVYATGDVGVGQANPAENVGGLVGSGADGSLSNSYATGAVVGTSRVGGFAGSLSGTQSNIYATGSVTSTGTGDTRAGGLVGEFSGTMTGGYAPNGVTAQGDNIGGLIGFLDSSATVTKSYATGAVVTQGANVGGLIGQAQPAYAVSDSFATGSVTTGTTPGVSGSVGGLIGTSFAGSVSTSYASGAVSGAGNIGGLIGNLTDYGNNAAGLTISDSYATGSVTGTGPAVNAATSYIGGLVGGEQHAEPTAGATTTITRSYATGLVSGQGVQGGLVGGNIGVIGNSIWDRTSTGQAKGVGGPGTSGTSNPATTSVTNLTSVQDTTPGAADYAFSQTPYANAGFSFGNIPGGGGGEVWVQVDVDGTFNGQNGAAIGTRPFLLMEASPNISNAHQLQLIDLYQYQQNPAPYTLISDVDASATATLSGMWGPQGFVPLTRVLANFDGQGHTISGLTVTTSVLDAGLFDTILQDLTVQNLTLAGGSVASTNSGVLGAGALAGSNQGSIVNVTTSASVSGLREVGGLVGENDGAITNAHASGAVSGGGSGYAVQLGGLVGFSFGGAITGSSASGAVSDLDTAAIGGSATGGLVGSNSSVLSNVSASGAVTSLADARAGGLIGDNTGAVDGGVASGAVSGAALTGGLIGQAEGPTGAQGAIANSYATGPVSGTIYVGGLVGASNNNIVNSYATGSVTGTSAYVGGLIGAQGFFQGYYGPQESLVATTIQNSYATGAVSGVQAVGGLVGQAATFAQVTGSHATGAVTGLAGANAFAFGGLIGLADGATVTGSYASGPVAGPGYAGGLVGLLTVGRDNNFGPVYGGVSTSYATGAVTSTDLYAGGLVGSNESESIADSYATGAVSGTGDVGGLVGQNLELNASNTANASSSNPLPTVTGTAAGATYASGAVTGSGDAVGGLVGDNQGVVSNAAYTGPMVSGASQVGGLVGLLEVATQVDANGANFYTPASVTGSNATGAVTGTGLGVGGVVGLSTGGSIADSFATGAVSGVSQVGGLVGANLNDTTSNPGTTYTASITGSAAGKTSATGSVTGTGTATGGLVGENQGTVTLAAYAPTGAGVSGADRVGGAVGLNDAGATLTNVTLVAVPVTSTSYTGGLIGDNSGSVTGSSFNGAVSGVSGVGGIAGVNEAGASIVATDSSGTVTGSGDDVGGFLGANFGTLGQAGVLLQFGGAVGGRDHVGGGVGQNFGTVTEAAANGATVSGRDYVGGQVGVNFGALTAGPAGIAVSGRNYVGGVAGWNDTNAVLSDGDSSAAVTATGNYVGGFAGVNKGTIAGSVVALPTVAGVQGSVAGADYVGGLVGLNEGAIGHSVALVPVSGSLYVGGLVGWDTANATVNTSYATGTVTGVQGMQEAGADNDYVGGLVGVNFGQIADSYATGAVSGVQVVGGLVGANMPGGTDSTGASYSAGSVKTSYATGAVSASMGAVGTSFGVQAGEVTSVYGFPSLSGQPVESGYYNAGATGDGADLSAAQEDGSLYPGFDPNVWQSNAGGPPTLKPATN